ncbi:hypothetical protein NC653_033428 [Populus alba x Populus x berolinensis]|uniref:Bifunctional inhibitor/plant lipid transfer protein/seed storage helical domain-containing protein n=1 Tax=Populus alba x Populus x berolinensis TaxID=444605 RepID=A0AAD6Q0V1_9ROSI|nr:hypothetical protein NC653_033428 [Populus alba x Populus x berolinensis]
MENLKVFVFTFFAVLLLLVFDVNGQLQPLPQRPLCVSQLALVNYACGTLLPAPPATSLPTATAALPADDDSNHGHGHRHRHSHGGLEENCCRWLSDVDPECVCELLVRLPPFLSKQHHEYTVKIDDTCSVSYSC